MQQVRERLRLRTIMVAAVVGSIAFVPTLIAKGQLDGWNAQDLLPWAREAAGPVGVTGEHMSAVCSELPRIGVAATSSGVILDFTDPPTGLVPSTASDRLAELGLAVSFAVEPRHGQPPGRIDSHGGDIEVVPASVIAPSGGRPSELTLPARVHGQLWFTLTCTPAADL